MRVAALMLGVIGGLFAMLIGFFSYGYTELASQHAAFAETFGAVDNPDLIRTASFLAPLLAIAGGAMAPARALWGGVLLLIMVAGGFSYRLLPEDVRTQMIGLARRFLPMWHPS